MEDRNAEAAREAMRRGLRMSKKFQRYADEYWARPHKGKKLPTPWLKDESDG